LGAVGYHRGRFLAVGSQGGIYERWTTPLPPSTCGRAFPDVPAPHPACQAIEALAAKGAVGGYQDGTFQPERVVTRAEFAKMLIRALGRQPLPEQQVAFSDVAGHWSATQGYLQAAVATGAINGFPNGTFEPDRPLTRAELVKAAAVLAGLRPEGEAPYVDVSASDWYDGWAASAARRGLIGPGAAVPVWDEEYFHGGLPSTRSEASAVLFNLIGQM
jgi:hypothetical protein